MTKKVLILALAAMFVFGASLASAEKFVFGKHAAEMAKCDAEMAKLKAETAVVAKDAADAKAKQDKFCKVVGFVPVVGLTMRLYNSGEMKACLAGKGSESYFGVKHVFFKLPAALPEHAATDFVYQFTGSDWRELDPVTVFLVDGRPYWMDAMVTGTKAFFMVGGAYALDVGLPGLGGHWMYAEPVNLAFLWGAAGGGAFSVLTGAANQAATGFSPYRQYYKDFKNWTGKSATMPALL